MLPFNIKIALVIAALLATFSAGWVAHGWKYDAEQFALQVKIDEAKDANDKLKTELGVQREKNTKLIATAAADLRDLRVRLPKSCKRTDTTTGGTVSTAGTDELPDEAQAALDRFKFGVDEVANDAAKDLEACRVVMEWAKSQGK